MIERRAILVELPERRRRAGPSLVPLIDLALILVLLFMLMTHLGHSGPPGIIFSSENFNALAEPDDGAVNGAAPLTLTLSAEGSVLLWDRRRVAIGELASILQERVGSIVLSGAATPAVAIVPEPDVPLQTLLDVMRIAQGNSFFKTHIIAPKLAAEVIAK